MDSVMIGGSTYGPSMEVEFDIKEKIDSIVSSEKDIIDIAIDLILYVIKT